VPGCVALCIRRCSAGVHAGVPAKPAFGLVGWSPASSPAYSVERAIPEKADNDMTDVLPAAVAARDFLVATFIGTISDVGLRRGDFHPCDVREVCRSV
jgi:hypothetical protein